MGCFLRQATSSDADAILAIYAPYVQNTATSFELEMPSSEAFRRRVEDIATTYPYLLCVEGDRIVGFAYASRHRERAAYAYDVDTTIYLSPQAQGRGIAQALYSALFATLREMGFFNAYAAITLPNPHSERFHTKFGFVPIGTHHKTGFKFGAWHDVLWLEKAIQRHADCPAPLKGLDDLPQAFPREVLHG